MTEGRRGIAIWTATAAGLGFFPLAPGTVGSLVGLAFAAAVARISGKFGFHSGIVVAAIVLIFGIGVWAAGRAERYFGKTDPGQVIVDEVAGQMIALGAFSNLSFKWMLAGFVLFRVFDIIKPFPARRAERLPGGWGIMVDDVIAGLYAALALAGFHYFVR